MMKECPSCHARYQDNTTFCPQCGADLDVNQEYFCTNCEQSFFGRQTTCPYCGSNQIVQKQAFIEE